MTFGQKIDTDEQFLALRASSFTACHAPSEKGLLCKERIFTFWRTNEIDGLSGASATELILT